MFQFIAEAAGMLLTFGALGLIAEREINKIESKEKK